MCSRTRTACDSDMISPIRLTKRERERREMNKTTDSANSTQKE